MKNYGLRRKLAKSVNSILIHLLFSPNYFHDCIKNKIVWARHSISLCQAKSDQLNRLFLLHIWLCRRLLSFNLTNLKFTNREILLDLLDFTEETALILICCKVTDVPKESQPCLAKRTINGKTTIFDKSFARLHDFDEKWTFPSLPLPSPPHPQYNVEFYSCNNVTCRGL